MRTCRASRRVVQFFLRIKLNFSLADVSKIRLGVRAATFLKFDSSGLVPLFDAKHIQQLYLDE